LLSALALSLPLVGCGDPEVEKANTKETAVVQTFASEDDCYSNSRYSEEQCHAFAVAAARELRDSRGFKTKEACDKEAKNCTPCDPTDWTCPTQSQSQPTAHGGGGYPYYLYNRAYAGNYYPGNYGFAVEEPEPGSRNNSRAYAVYENGRGSLRTVNGVEGFENGGISTVSRSALRAPATEGGAAPFRVTQVRPGVAEGFHASPVRATTLRAGSGASIRGGFGGGMHASYGG
jgi:hypothetical protein